MGVRVELTDTIVVGDLEVSLASVDAHAHALFHKTQDKNLQGLAAVVMALVDLVETLERPS